MGTNTAVLDPNVGARLIETAGSVAFAPLLIEIANRVANVDEIFAYRAHTQGEPDALLSASRLQDAAARAKNYVQHFFRFDPVTQLRASCAQEAFTVSVKACELTEPHYRSMCFDGPRFADKLCFGWRDATNATVLSFYRRDAALADEAGLAPLANLTLSILARENQRPERFADLLEHKLAFRFPELSRRERQVCARTIAGQTAEECAAELGIRPTTVITYRQRAYQRLNFRAAHDFLPLLLH